MTEDPLYITQFDWAKLGTLLILIWVLVVVVVGLAGSALLAHGVIPSLKASRELPDPRLVKLRPLLYGAEVFFLALAGVVVGLLVARAEVIAGFYERWWV